MKNIDTNTVKELIKGNQKAFNCVVDRYYKSIWLYFHQKTKRHEIADELTNDVFNRVWKYRNKIDANHGGIEAYLRQIAYRIFMDWRQQVDKEKKHMADYSADYVRDDHTVGGEDALNARMDLTTISERLTGVLPEKCGRAFLLSRVHGMSYEEIAEEMSISKDTVRNHLIKAKKALSKWSGLWKYP